MYTPANIDTFDQVFVSPFSPQAHGYYFHTQKVLASPASGAYATADRVHYVPFYVARPYSLARWWWLNGATVGTNLIQVGIYDENLNLFKASPRTLSAGTANQLQFVNPGIHGMNVSAGSDSTDSATYTTASVTLKAGVLYLLSVNNSHGSSAHVISSVDNGPTFTSRSSVQFNASVNRESIWSAVPTTDYTGTLVINFGANTETGATWSIDAFYHVDTATNHGVVQNATGTGTSTTPLATLAAFGSANNATFGAFGEGGSSFAGTPSTGYIELADLAQTTPSGRLMTYFRPDNDTTVDCTITSAAWGACAVEIKSLGTGAVALPPMRGYLAIHCNGTTATLFRTTAGEMGRQVVNSQNAQATGFPASATFTAINPVQPVYDFGFTSRSSP